MQRFFLDDVDLQAGGIVDLTPIRHQLTRVLRMQPGNEIVVLDGAGRAGRVVLETLESGASLGRVVAADVENREPATQLTLYQCTLKADKFEWILQKGTELGVSRFVPVLSRRCIVRPATRLLKRYDRWRTVIREAAEQSGRNLLPFLADPVDFEKAVSEANDHRLLPWEGAARRAPGIGTQLAGTHESISLLIGPEGGLEAGEVAQAVQLGWQTVSLGPRILRAETAALAAVTIILNHMGELEA